MTHFQILISFLIIFLVALIVRMLAHTYRVLGLFSTLWVISSIGIILLILSSTASAETYTFKNELTITAPTFKQAASVCYKTITKNKYVSEEFNMTAIDICANPIKGSVLK